MDDKKLKLLYEKAEADRERAQQELSRPSTDVVRYSACSFARRSLHQYMMILYTYYKQKNSEQIKEGLTLDELVRHVRTYDKDVDKMDFSKVQCSCTDVLNESEDEIIYCEDINRVEYCKSLAEKLNHMINNKSIIVTDKAG